MRTRDNNITKLDFQEPREPRIPRKIINLEKGFLESSSMKISKTNERKELALNLARKKLEGNHFEDNLAGKAKDRARSNRLDKKNHRGIFGSK